MVANITNKAILHGAIMKSIILPILSLHSERALDKFNPGEVAKHNFIDDLIYITTFKIFT
jgi:hypothetical protein